MNKWTLFVMVVGFVIGLTSPWGINDPMFWLVSMPIAGVVGLAIGLMELNERFCK